MIWIGILLVVAALVVGFYAGVRYSYRTLIAVWLSRMDEKELEDLARRAASERRPDL